MAKLLEKALRDGVKEDRCTTGCKEVLRGMGNASIIVMSKSVSESEAQKISESAEKSGVSAMRFSGTSVALGKLCGLQYRVSALSLSSLNEATVTSIIKESA